MSLLDQIIGNVLGGSGNSSSLPGVLMSLLAGNGHTGGGALRALLGGQAAGGAFSAEGGLGLLPASTG